MDAMCLVHSNANKMRLVVVSGEQVSPRERCCNFWRHQHYESGLNKVMETFHKLLSQHTNIPNRYFPEAASTKPSMFPSVALTAGMPTFESLSIY